MKRLAVWLQRLLFAVAWTLVACAAALVALEESGVLTRIVEERIARELGDLGARVDVERARLRWFEPGLVLEGITFDGERGPDGAWREGRERVRLSEVHVRLHPLLDPEQLIGEVEVRGGRVALGDPLLDAVRTVVAERRARPALPGPEPLLPPIAVRGIALELELAGAAPLPLGRADLRLLPAPEGGAALLGRVSPLGGAVLASADLRFEGRIGPDGPSLRAALRGLQLDSAGLPPAQVERLLRGARLRGELAFDLEAGRDPDGSARVDVRADLEHGALERPGEAALGDLDLSLAAAWRPQADKGLLDPEAWTATARAAGRCDRSRAQGALRVGTDADEDPRLAGWLSVEQLPIDEATLRALHVDQNPSAREVFLALEPRGAADADVAFRARRAAPGAPLERAVAADVRLRGNAGLTYRGWQDEHGARLGLPIPCDGVSGQVAVSWDEALPQRALIGLVGLSGDHGSGQAFADGLLASSLAGRELDLDLAIRVPRLAVGPATAAGMAGMEPTRKLWEDLHPTGGELSAEFRVRGRQALGGVTAHGVVDLHDVGIQWKPLPVPLAGVSGRIELRWADMASVIVDAPLNPYHKLPAHRPLGVLWRMSTAPSSGLSAKACGGLHEEPLAREVRRAEIPLRPADWLELDLTEVFLRGRDFDALAASLPELGARVHELRAQGRVAASFRGRRHAPAEPYRYDLEITAGEDAVVLTPEYFRRQTQDVTGRILVKSEEVPGADKGKGYARFALFGAWGGDVTLSSTGFLPSSGGGSIAVRGAGVDPTSPTLKGALSTSLSEEPGSGEGVDLSTLEVDGRLDFEALIALPLDPSAQPDSTYRVFLRENRLRSEQFALESLHGVFTQEDKVLRSPFLRASLAGSPVELRNVMLLPVRNAGEVAGADARLADASFLARREGYALQADWQAPGLTLDREHLAPFVDEETLRVLLEKTGLSGAVDVGAARVLAVIDPDGRAKVAFQGRVTPRGMHLDVALPLVLERGSIDVEDLVLESGRLRGWWRIEGLAAEISGREIEDASMIMTYVDGRLTVDNLRGSFAGGEVTSLGGVEQADRAIAIDLTPPYAYTIALRLEHVAVAEFLADLFDSSVDDLGALNAALRLRGRGGDVLAMNGGGKVEIANARLWSIPVVRELFRTLGADATAVFDHMELDWALEHGTLKLSDIRVRSPLLSLVGEGTVELTGEVKSDLQVRYALVDKLGPLNRFVYWLNNSLWRVGVRGDLARPEVTIRNSLLEFFFGFDEEHERSLPLPSWSPLSTRF